MAMATGHDNCTVNCVIRLADGRLASCGDDKTVKLWDNVAALVQAGLMGTDTDAQAAIAAAEKKVAEADAAYMRLVENVMKLQAAGELRL
jgi:hypothetical protein